MKNNINYSPEALKDLDEIWEYISENLYNTKAAESTVNRIINSIDKLEDFAEIGRRLSEVVNIDLDYRFLVSGSYLVFYRAYNSDVYIDRILYGKRDYMRILFPEATEYEEQE